MSLRRDNHQYIPSVEHFTPIRMLLPAFPKLSYQIFFSEETPKAIAELNSDVARTLRATIRSARHPPPDAYLRDTTSFMKAYDDIEVRGSFLVKITLVFLTLSLQ